MLWIKALRLPAAIMASLLVVISFIWSHWDKLTWLVAGGVLIIAAATMVQNILVPKNCTTALEGK